MEKNYVSLKLLIDKERERVLIAEAGKKFIDFLLHILALPLSTFIPLFESKEWYRAASETFTRALTI